MVQFEMRNFVGVLIRLHTPKLREFKLSQASCGLASTKTSRNLPQHMSSSFPFVESSTNPVESLVTEVCKLFMHWKNNGTMAVIEKWH